MEMGSSPVRGTKTALSHHFSKLRRTLRTKTVYVSQSGLLSKVRPIKHEQSEFSNSVPITEDIVYTLSQLAEKALLL